MAGGRSAALNVCLGWLVGVLSLGNGREEPSTLQKSVRRYFMAGKQCFPQWGHKDFEVNQWWSSGLFMIASCCERSSLFLCPASQTYVYYPKNMRDDLARLLHLDEIRIPPSSVFVDHCYLQQAGSGWNGHHVHQYHIFIIRNDYNSKDAVAFSYGSSLKPWVLWSTKKPNGQKPMSREESDNWSSDESMMDKWMLEACDTPGA